MICIASKKQKKNLLKHHQGQERGSVLSCLNRGGMFLRIPNVVMHKNSKFPTVHLLHCQFMFLDYSLDVNCQMSVWALQYSPYQGWKLPTR